MASDTNKATRRGRGPDKALSRSRDLTRLWSRTEGLTASAIMDRLISEQEERPHPNSIRRWMDEAKGAGPTWTLGMVGSGGSSAAIVLRALGTLAWASGNRRVTITQEEAKWTVRIARAAPTIEPFVAFQIGKLYSDRLAHGRETRSLDVYLGAAPWNDDKVYLNIIENDGVEEWFGQGWHPGLGLGLRQYYSNHPELGLDVTANDEPQGSRSDPPLDVDPVGVEACSSTGGRVDDDEAIR